VVCAWILMDSLGEVVDEGDVHNVNAWVCANLREGDLIAALSPVDRNVALGVLVENGGDS